MIRKILLPRIWQQLLSFKWLLAQKFHGFCVVYSWKKMHVLFMATSLGGMQLNISNFVIGWHLREAGEMKNKIITSHWVCHCLTSFALDMTDLSRLSYPFVVAQIVSSNKQGKTFLGNFTLLNVIRFGLLSDYLFKRTLHSNCFIYEAVQVFSS